MGTATTVDEFEAQRGRLFGLAYRMLGEVQEAEDAVQDAFLRWHQADRSHIDNPGAWLAKVVTNLCLNRLTSARARRESYVGPWLPEPVLSASFGPLETAEQRDSVSIALLTLLERLSPAERAAFVLREAFDYSHRDVATVLETSEANARQLHRRARQHLEEQRERPRFEAGAGQLRGLVEQFLMAAVEGDVATLEASLAADVVAWADGGGKVTAALRAVSGPSKVARLLVGLVEKYGTDFAISIDEVNGSLAVVVREADGAMVIVVGFELDADGQVRGLFLMRNPDKMEALRGQLGELADPV